MKPDLTSEPEPNRHHKMHTGRARRTRCSTWLAIILFAAPFIVAGPLHHWSYNHAPSWWVSTRIDPDQRQMFLGLMYLVSMAAITILSVFSAFTVLVIGGVRHVFVAVAMGATGVLLIPAFVFVAIVIYSYFEFG